MLYTFRSIAAQVGAVVICALAGDLTAVAGDPVADLEFFEKNIRPLLAAHCYECHSASTETPEAGLLLDRRAGLVDGGDSGPAIDLQDPDESLLLSAVRYESFEMPPDGKLNDDGIDLLERWIRSQAPWPDEPPPKARGPAEEEFDLSQRAVEHWAWQPVVDPPAPEVSDPTWPRNPLDRFIFAQLDEHGLVPADDADRRTLLRRLSFALTGLPPNPSEVEQFAGDASDDAVERAVDRMLASPAFGQRWARHWLDLVRYAETRGHESDFEAPHAYHYRDYVIRALNADVPYDQFVKEQIAGDLLPQPRLNSDEGFNESIIGTGFWHLGDWVHSPVDTRKDETDRFDNMIDVMSKTFLGVTVACARCHDHKFDAIASADYYAMSGYLQSSNYRLTRIDGWRQNHQIAERLAEFDLQGNARLKQVLADLIGNRSERLGEYITAAVELAGAGSGGDVSGVGERAAQSSLDERLLGDWVDAIVQQPAGLTDLLNLVEARQQDSTADNTQPANCRVVVDFGILDPYDWRQDGHSFGSGPMPLGAFFVEEMVDANRLRVASSAAARFDPAWKGLTEVDAFRKAKGSKLHKFPRAGRTLRTPTFTLSSGVLQYELRGGCRVFVCVDSHRMIEGPLHSETMLDVAPDKLGERRWVRHDLQRYIGSRVHVEFTTRDDAPLAIYQIVDGQTHCSQSTIVAGANCEIDADALGVGLDALQRQLRRGEVMSAPTAAAADWIAQRPHLLASADSKVAAEYWAAINDHAMRRAKIAKGIVRTSRVVMAMQDGSPENESLLIRGNHKNPGQQVPRRFLTALGGVGPAERRAGSGRLQLAEQIVDTTNPLTYRVIVNRVWAQLFGRGIAASPDDLGVLGQRPTHPELLDHLAARFLTQHDRSLKKLIRSIVLSRTYQLSSDVASTAAELDPQNLWLSHFNVRRLEGEAIRDSLLAISGRLDTTMFGPPIPVHLTSFMQGRGRPGKSGPLDGAGRRSIYMAVRRNFLMPMMTAFDAPPPSTTQGRRNNSNLPAQSLILLNDPFVREQARLWAQRTIDCAEDNASRLDEMYQQAFARLPTVSERTVLDEYLDFRSAEAGAEEIDVWTDVALSLINVKEFTLVF